MPNYIILDGMRYITTDLGYDPSRNKAQQVLSGLTGKTISLNFNQSDYRWTVPILVEITPSNPEHGSEDDLETAYAKEYVTYIDRDGVDQGYVFMLGQLSKPRKFALVDTSAPYKTTLSLRKRQV